ncbi:hypothetical protein [Gloeothece verrucosa]|uniref:Uncharacterized protein n=1 Tax=Gloeothece verrucosa (strain PCC 7822) TaxID=497965 RepID=E0U6D1_GLOV7|nr:hypothetical protein [Gloeothece verrucosa]ADN13574.1 hypothetical protein Cyan7822_1583 [Gloeothece verrucosa PCC 7822]
MFISKLLQIQKNRHQNRTSPVKSQITVKPFIDLFLDTAGWYTLGHCDRREFLAAVIKKEKYPYSNFRLKDVQLAWAKVDANNFELVDKVTDDALPITLVEDIGQLGEY